jgi:hypothetical protein
MGFNSSGRCEQLGHILAGRDHSNPGVHRPGMLQNHLACHVLVCLSQTLDAFFETPFIMFRA